MDFLIPSAADVPGIEQIHTETPSPNNPLGIKGVGEAGTIPVSAVIANAVSDALGGIDVDHMPLTPEDVVRLVNDAVRRAVRSAPDQSERNGSGS